MYWPSKLQVPLWLALDRSAGPFVETSVASSSYLPFAASDKLPPGPLHIPTYKSSGATGATST